MASDLDPVLKKIRDRARSELGYAEYIRTYGYPPKPLFKPQSAPADTLGDMVLPPSEFDIAEEERKIFSCPTGGLLGVKEEDEMSEEEDELDKYELCDKVQDGSKGEKASNMIEEKPSLQKGTYKSPNRFRSRSEQVKNVSIFKFMGGNEIKTQIATK